MGSRQLGADFNFAWPTARIAVMGAEGAAQQLIKRFPDRPARGAADQGGLHRLLQPVHGHPVDRGRARIHRRRHRPAPARLLLRKSLHLLRDKRTGPGLDASTA